LGTNSTFAAGPRKTTENLHLPAAFKIFTNSVPTSKKTQRVSITKINRLMLFREKIAVYSQNHTKYAALCGKVQELLIVRAGGTYSYHLVLRDKRSQFYLVPTDTFYGNAVPSRQLLRHIREAGQHIRMIKAFLWETNIAIF
jgi:hypothetical protein